MSVLFLAVGTTRARAVCTAGRFLAERGVPVTLLTTSAAPWAKEGLDERVAVVPLETRLDKKLLATSPVNKVYRLMRPYAMWRSARRRAVKDVDWAAVEQVVVFDSHAIPIGWHVARRQPRLAVGFELDRAPYADRVPAGSPDPNSDGADEK
jgi:hypothetical protein